MDRVTGARDVDTLVLTVASDEALIEAQALLHNAAQLMLFSHTCRGLSTGLDLATGENIGS